MHLEARRTRVFTVDRDKYAPPTAGAQERVELLFDPFAKATRYEGGLQFNRCMTRAGRCKRCRAKAAVNRFGECWKCVTDDGPRVEPAQEVFE